VKIGVSSYSFSGTGLKSLELPGKAKEMGFDAIEFAEFRFKPEDRDPMEHAEMLLEESKKVGIKINAYSIGADFLKPDLDWEAEVERLKGEVDIAEKLGVSLMRHDVSSGFPKDYEGPPSFDAAVPILAKGCRAVAEYAAEKGIKTMVENHGRFCQDSVRVEKLITETNHPNFGALVDIGNFLCADEDPAVAVGRMAPHAFYAHVKDFHVKSGSALSPGRGWITTRAGNYLRGAIIGHGEVPVLQCLRLLVNNGYDEIISIEFEGMEPKLLGIELGLQNLRSYLKYLD